jgi:hypothetical protein
MMAVSNTVDTARVMNLILMALSPFCVRQLTVTIQPLSIHIVQISNIKYMLKHW